MDNLNVPLVWIENRCYRTVIMADSSSEQAERADEQDAVECMASDENTRDDQDVASPDESVASAVKCHSSVTRPSIEHYREGGYVMNFDIPPALCGIVVGTKGTTRMRIEHDTGTIITVPKHEAGLTSIKGPNAHGIERAYDRITELLNIARTGQLPTHFLSVPLTSDIVVKGFQEFQAKVLDTCKADQGVFEDIFQKAVKFHLTIAVMALLNDAERQRATKVLRDCTNTVLKAVLDGKPLIVHIKGLEIMNDDPSAVDVLYAKVFPTDFSNRLQLMADLLFEHFLKANLVQQKDRDQVKLHATVANSRFLHRNDELQKKSRGRRQSFDARRILDDFGDYDFGEQQIDEIHLSRRHSTAKNGYYQSTAKLQLLTATVDEITNDAEKDPENGDNDSIANCKPEVKQIKEKLFELRMNIPTSLCGLVVGKKGSTRIKLEWETNTSIDIPDHKEEPTVIQGGSSEDVKNAYFRIQKILKGGRLISIPEKETQARNSQPETEDQVQTRGSASVGCTSHIKQLKEGIFEVNMRIPAVLHGAVIGRNGITRRRIADETDTIIKVPYEGEGVTVIRGCSRRDVEQAYSRIKYLVDVSRSRHPITHILSLPLMDDVFIRNVKEFVSQVLDTCMTDNGIHERLFMDPQELQMTIQGLVLLNELEVNTAKEVLKECENTVLRGALRSRPLNVRVRGLEVQGKDPSAVSLLFVKLSVVEHDHESDRLKKLDIMLMEHFAKFDLTEWRRHEVPLYVALMDSRCEERLNTFDARRILEKFRNFDFGTFRMKTVQLVQLPQKITGLTQSILASLPLP